MRRKLSLIIQVIILLVVGTAAGAGVGRVIPYLGGTPAKAEGLSAQMVTAPGPAPAGSGFTYQGRLKDTGSPASGQYDFAFAMYDDPNAGNLVSGPITRTNQTVTEGLFTLTLDFGANAFDGNARYLQINAKRSADPNYTTLTGRQPITPAPYALFALKTQPYKNVVTVAQAGGQYTSIQAALDSITDNSASNPYLVWVGPGTYTETVTMKSYVDVEGAGENTTKITYTGSNGPASGTVQFLNATAAELRSVTVENTGGPSTGYAVAIYTFRGSPSLLNVTATASGSTDNYAVYNSSSNVSMNNVTATAPANGVFGRALKRYALYNYSSTVSMNNVTATAESAADSQAVDNDISKVTMNNVTATALGSPSYAVYNHSSDMSMNNGIASGATGVGQASGGVSKIHNSTIRGSNYYITNNGGPVKVGASQLTGGRSLGSGPVTCAGVYDGNYVFYPNTCP